MELSFFFKCFYSGTENCCKICYKEFSNASGFLGHFKQGNCRQTLEDVHKEDLKKKKKKTAIKCKECSDSFFSLVRFYHHKVGGLV